MPTVTPILRTVKDDVSGRAPVWVRVSDTAGTRYLATGVKVHPDDWNEEERVVRRSRKDHRDLNGISAAKVGAAEAALNRARLGGREPTADGVKWALNRKGHRDFYAFVEEAVTRMEQRRKADSARCYRHVVFRCSRALIPARPL